MLFLVSYMHNVFQRKFGDLLDRSIFVNVRIMGTWLWPSHFLFFLCGGFFYAKMYLCVQNITQTCIRLPGFHETVLNKYTLFWLSWQAFLNELPKMLLQYYPIRTFFLSNPKPYSRIRGRTVPAPTLMDGFLYRNTNCSSHICLFPLSSIT